ncbi:MAG TPA: IclR family transcriptional regulator [Azospirillaceae bacterium]|nr:IclR family transcriptional regulator [Azospirillaceae bacterium]
MTTGTLEPEAPAEGPADGDRQFVTALARGLEVLRAFTPAEPLLGNRELADRTGLPKPTVARLTHTLTRLGYLVQAGRAGKYRLGAPVLSLGYAVLGGSSVRQVARPHMQALADACDASVALGARDGLSMVYLENCRSPTPVTLQLETGSRLPLATSAMGKALLAFLPEAERRALLDQARRADPAAWPRVECCVMEALEHFDRHGFVLSLGDWEPQVHGVGVPLPAPDGGPPFAFNLGGPSWTLPRERLVEELGPRLVHMARTVRDALAGHQPR